MQKSEKPKLDKHSSEGDKEDLILVVRPCHDAAKGIHSSRDFQESYSRRMITLMRFHAPVSSPDVVQAVSPALRNGLNLYSLGYIIGNDYIMFFFVATATTSKLKNDLHLDGYFGLTDSICFCTIPLVALYGVKTDRKAAKQ